jgi:hypothetical protein
LTANPSPASHGLVVGKVGIDDIQFIVSVRTELFRVNGPSVLRGLVSNKGTILDNESLTEMKNGTAILSPILDKLIVAQKNTDNVAVGARRRNRTSSRRR